MNRLKGKVSTGEANNQQQQQQQQHNTSNEIILTKDVGKDFATRLLPNVHLSSAESAISLLSQHHNVMGSLSPNPSHTIPSYLKPLYIRYPSVVQLNTDNYYNGLKIDTKLTLPNETDKSGEDDSLYDKVYKEEIYNSNGSGKFFYISLNL